MKIFLFLILIFISNYSISQKNKINSDGQRKGDWLIMYKGNLKYLGFQDQLLDLSSMLSINNETNTNIEAKYFESVTYKNGEKEGDFFVYSDKKNNSGNNLLLASGKYLKGKLSGNIIMAAGFSCKYDSGNILNQEIVTSNTYALFGNEKIYPLIKFKNGICIEETTNLGSEYDSRLCRIIRTDSCIIRYLYVNKDLDKPISLNRHSLFLTVGYLEVACLNNNYKPNGLVAYYEKTNNLFDMSFCFYKATFKNGKKNGIEYWFDTNDNKILQECNFIDGIPQYPIQTFKQVIIGNKNWMSENLNSDKFRNGDIIFEAKSKQDWIDAGKNRKAAYCYLNFDSKNGPKYGKLYNWYAVNDDRGLAPLGWHIPNNEEWKDDNNGPGARVIGSAQKIKTKTGWKAPDINDVIYTKCVNCVTWSNEYRKKTPCHVCKDTRRGSVSISKNKDDYINSNSKGFNGAPFGSFEYNEFARECLFGKINEATGWWSSSKSDSSAAEALVLTINSNELMIWIKEKISGYYVRCVEDNKY